MLENFIFITAIFSIKIFFSMFAILGLSYSGVDSGSAAYWGFLIILLASAIFYYMKEKNKSRKISKKEIIIILLILLFGLNVLLVSAINLDQFYFIIGQALFFLIFFVPAALSGWYFSKSENNLIYFTKNLEIIMILMTVAILLSTFPVLLGLQSFEGIGGGTYQDASYIAALSFGINLFYLSFGEKLNRYKICNTVSYKFIQCIMLAIQLLGLLVGGGRGAFVLVIVYIAFSFIILFIQNKMNRLLKLILFLLFLVLIAWLIIRIFNLDISILESGINRITEFITSSGINWDATSGRDNLYFYVLNIIRRNPFFGIGVFNYQRPHNLFLEIVAGYGVFGGIALFILGIALIIKFYRLIKFDFKNISVLIVFLSAFVMLMFSGSVFRSSEFAFGISYAFFLKTNKISTSGYFK